MVILLRMCAICKIINFRYLYAFNNKIFSAVSNIMAKCLFRIITIFAR